MAKSIITLGMFLLISLGQSVSAQSKQEKADIKAREAIELMDNGKVDESIKLLQEAIKLDPGRFDLPYEMAYAYYLKADYKKAAKTLEKLRNHEDATALLYQLLGNSYDMQGKPAKAIEIYDAGLEKFPDAGPLYLEKGNMHWNKKEYNEALVFYEKGIEVNPEFPSNYYRAARIFLSSTEEVWGLIYGEIFMNLERNTIRTEEISELMFNVYKSEIKFTSDTSMTVSFCQQMTMDISDLTKPGGFKLPFCMIYEPTLLGSIVEEKEIDINSLDRIRTSFIESYYKSGHEVKYPNILFDYQRKLLNAGHFESYNHWLLMKGDEAGFSKWQSANKDKWEAFVEWYGENALIPTSSNKFFRAQY